MIGWEEDGAWRVHKSGNAALYAAPTADGAAWLAIAIVNGWKMLQTEHSTRDAAMAAAEDYVTKPIEVRHLEADGPVDLSRFSVPMVEGRRLRAGDSILLLAQPNVAENGVYVIGDRDRWGVAPLTRVTDFKLVGGPGYRATVRL